MRLSHVLLCSSCILIAACGTKAIKPSDKHIQQAPGEATRSSSSIPPTSKSSVVLPLPKPAVKVETYDVIFINHPAKDILFELARDAKINIDIHPGIQGEVTINAIKQTLPQILDRIANQVDIRYELNNGNLIVIPDTPFLKSYKIDYVNMSRDSEGGISNTSQIGGSTASGTSTATGNNSSKLSITNTSKNHFWDTLIKNITDILLETDKDVLLGSRKCGSQAVSAQANQLESSASGSGKTGVRSDSVFEGASTKGEGDQKSAGKAVAGQKSEQKTDCQDYVTQQKASVIPNPESGIITVRATGKQHEKIQEFVTQVMRNARRQVLIEATIAEVRLNSNYQQGINWSKLAGAKALSIGQAGTPLMPNSATATVGALVLNYTNPTAALGNLSGSVSLLETFGDVKVLSSPKLSVLNNQTAMLRVVDNNVYFIVSSTTTPATTLSGPITTYTTTVNTVPVGFSMSITPQINDNDTVLLNVRPTITRLLTPATDPTPGLTVTNKIPQVSTREMESVLKIENNQIAILGGLMQDEISNQSDGIPLLNGIPFAGNAFKNRNDNKIKTELVIFLRPVVIKDASIDGDFSAYRSNLPDENFLKPENEKARP